MKINKYLYTLLLTGVLGACSLEEEPYGFISTENFYQTEGDAHSSLIYAYSLLPEIEYYSRNFIALTEIPTENISIKPDGGASNWELDELRPLANNAEASTAFRYGFIGINRSNSILANVPDIQMDPTVQNQILGEAYFLRALHYFNLVRLFGAVPLRTSPINSQEDAFMAKATMGQLYEQIIEDLERGIELMDVTHRHGRADKVAGWSLLSKVHLTLASAKSSGSPGYEFVQDATAHYNHAATNAGRVLNEQDVYGLEEDLMRVFDIQFEDGKEHIFSVSTDVSGELEGNYSKLPLMFLPSIDGATFLLSPDREAATRVASGWNHFITEPGLYNSFEPADRRKTDLIVSTVYLDKGEGEPLEERMLAIDGWSRPFTIKYLDPARIGDKTGVNTPVIRFADIMLVYAEAAGPTAEGYAAINAVRERAGLDPLEQGLTVDAFREAVILERKWELAFEGHRLFDLRRTNKMEQMAKMYGKEENRQGDLYFFAIPQVEVDVNTEL